MRDTQALTFLETWGGFAGGMISSEKRNAQSGLSEILETGPVPARYYLSARACAGILRRAEKRGKELPLALRQALETVAQRTGPDPAAQKTDA